MSVKIKCVTLFVVMMITNVQVYDKFSSILRIIVTRDAIMLKVLRLPCYSQKSQTYLIFQNNTKEKYKIPYASVMRKLSQFLPF